MIDQISQYAASFLASIDGNDEDRSPIYQVGFDVLISTGITLAGILALGLILHNLQGSIVFLLCFMTVRSYSGGYHAKTRTRCFFLTCGAYLLTAIIPQTELIHRYWLCSILTTGIVITVWYLYVPVENRNKRLPVDWKITNRRKAWISAGIWNLLPVVIRRWDVQLSFQIVMTNLVIAILILWCRPWKEKV